MSYYSDGHTALDSKLLERIETPDLKLVLINRILEDGKEDLVVHGNSGSIIFGSHITTLAILIAAGFSASRSCVYFSKQNCVYKVFPSGLKIDLKGISEAVPIASSKMREAESILNKCGWSMIREHQESIQEGHRVAQKEVMKTTEDNDLKYILTYTKDQYGNGRFVTHFIPKQGYTTEFIAVMKWLELKDFNGCPESTYKRCFFTTLDNTQTNNLRNRTADRAHQAYDNLASQFGKAYHLILDADSRLRTVGLQILDIHNTEPIPVITKRPSTTPVLTTPKSRAPDNKTTSEWDIFICHASEDKDRFVRQLATNLRAKGLKVWYDEFTLKVGDSLRQSIETGLAKSRYGIVILSPNFFAKRWPQDELNGLAAKERNGEKVILPVWLDVDERYITQFSPILADRLAAKASYGMSKVVSDLLEAIKS
jgi:hypothetical protein